MISKDNTSNLWFDEVESVLNRKENAGKSEAEEESFTKIVEFSPEMSAYQRELQNVIKALKSIDALGTIFDNVLLVSIDEGCGYFEFANMILEELKKAFGLEQAYIQMVEETYPTDKKIETWNKQFQRIERIRMGSRFAVLTYDLTNAVSEWTNPMFKKNMREIKKRAKDIFLIFRVPYMDRKTLNIYHRIFSDIMSVRLVVVPPVSIENMVIYLREKLQKAITNIDDVCDDLFEQWICQEKSEGVFCGYETLDKMAAELIYQKALGAKDGDNQICDMKRVVAEDVQKMLTNPLEAEDAYDLLNELIGMAQLKTTVREMVAQIKLQKELEDQGKNIEKPSLHMLFFGNPGTGKTTVARIIGQIFKQEGLLRKGHFIEMSGSDLISGNITATMEKIRSTCRDSYGSVLFFDEAYGINIGHSSGNVADEILPTLVAEMENHRDDMCVILAGYKDEMEEFLKANSGLRSRIPHVLEFPNYTREELVDIFFHMVNGRFEYEDALKETLGEYIQNIPEGVFQTKEFSNARFIRNLYERLWGKAAYRISLSGEKEIVLKKEDMVRVMEEEDFKEMVTEKNKKQIGFCLR